MANPAVPYDPFSAEEDPKFTIKMPDGSTKDLPIFETGRKIEELARPPLTPTQTLKIVEDQQAWDALEGCANDDSLKIARGPRPALPEESTGSLSEQVDKLRAIFGFPTEAEVAKNTAEIKAWDALDSAEDSAKESRGLRPLPIKTLTDHQTMRLQAKFLEAVQGLDVIKNLHGLTQS